MQATYYDSSLCNVLTLRWVKITPPSTEDKNHMGKEAMTGLVLSRPDANQI